jgi:D-glycero-D-manno-heptose 1,7-bisphosphate phosphatase
LWKRIYLARAPAVFVDRDDTLMVDVKYCSDPALVKLIPGAAEGLRTLRKAGYRVVVVTNQSGIGRGYFDAETLERVNGRLRDELRREGADYDALYYCPHVPEEDCQCRKPKPGLLLRAASELNIDLASSYTLGDRDLDVGAGRAAGTKTILVSQTEDRSGSKVESAADFVAASIVDAAKIILSGSRGRDERAG